MKATLSVCMICKNEEKSLPALLQQVRNVADEIIFVDTGSEDQSIEIAKQYNAKIYHWQWTNHFGEARNESLRHATGEWILIIDCDDELTDTAIEKIQEFIQISEAEGCYVQYNNIVSTSEDFQVRNVNIDHKLTLFRNRPEYFFIDPIHETIEDSMTASNIDLHQLPISNIVITHHGYENQERKIEKELRNLFITEETIKKNGEKPYYLYNKAVSSLNLSNYDEAITLLQKLKEVWNASHSLYSDVLYKIALCYYKNKQLALAQQELYSAIQIYPDFTDLHYFSAYLHYIQQEWNEAESKWKNCLLLGDAHARYSHMKGTGSYLSWHGIAQCYSAKHQFKLAVDAYFKSLEFHPDNPLCKRQLLIVLADHFSFTEAYHRLSTVFDLTNSDIYLSLVSLAEQTQRLEFAYLLLLHAEETGVILKNAADHQLRILKHLL